MFVFQHRALVSDKCIFMPPCAITLTSIFRRRLHSDRLFLRIPLTLPTANSSHLFQDLHTRSFTTPPTHSQPYRCRNIARSQYGSWHPIQKDISRRFLNTPSAKLIRKDQTMPPFVGAIDQGTTSSRFIIFDTQGAPVAQHQIEFKQIYPHPGHVEDCNLHSALRRANVNTDGTSTIQPSSYLQYRHA